MTAGGAYNPSFSFIREEESMEKKRQIAAVLILLALIGVIAYRHSTGKDLEKYEASFFDVFDTQTQIIGYASSKEQFSEQMSLIKDKFQYYNDLYDIYHDYEGMNNIKTINDNAGIQSVKVDEEIIELLKLGITMDEKTDGNMNIAMGSVLSIWHDYREAGSEDPDSAELPPMDELERAAEHTDIHDIVIDEEASTVYLTDPDMSLDVGSIGKGYAVQKVAEYAKNELGIQYMLFSVGGNVCAIGGHPDGSAWAVGIQNPDVESNQAYIKKVEVQDLSVVTSGNYQRYYTVNGKRYCHIINQDTLMPADNFSSVTIITNDSGMADAYSTAVFNMPLVEGMEFVNQLDGVEAMWILEDGSIQYSDGFEEYTR